jgi:acylphosphatase
MTSHRLHARISGLVQGVYFRDTTRHTALALGLTGWVRNQADGSVEVMAEGPHPQLDSLLEFLRVGPSHAQVENVAVDWPTATGEFVGFEIKW